MKLTSKSKVNGNICIEPLICLVLDFLLAASRDAQAAVRFLRKVLIAVHTQELRVININKNAAYPKVIDELKEKKELSEVVELRDDKYINNTIEEDHRGIKRVVRLEMNLTHSTQLGEQ